ncbi:MAG: carbohydrate ABC transporter permease [Anaerolineae bacterium]|nr:carbohydrate ABC transporter permease [Anaerolineae bacterium]MDW8098250.1 carbohydrate ABC transporter permease [Anaerolineae bacterium]
MARATQVSTRSRAAMLIEWRSSRYVRTLMVQTLAYLVVTAGAVVLMIPFAWMLSSSLKPLDRIFVEPPEWIPKPIMWRNYIDAWNALPFTRFLMNTLFVTLLGMGAGIFSSCLVAYGFARFRFPGRDVLFIVLLSTMMLPYVVTLIPTFVIWRNLGLINTYDPLVLGALFGGGPFFVFLVRQFMLTIPMEMEEAARMDGANTFQIFIRIMLPLIRPAMLAVGIFSFQGYWNDFLAPLIYLNDLPKYTMTLGMFFFLGGPNEPPRWHWLMAMSTVIAIPILAVFFLAQRYFIEGIALTGIKG